MAEVFLSYTHEDADAVRRIEKALRDLGVEVWIDNRLATGAHLTEHIQQQIAEAQAVIVCWSKKAVESKWVYGEALYALHNDKLTPVIVASCELRPPFNTVLASDLTSWRGEVNHPGWQRLLLSLEKALDGVRKLADPELVKEFGVSNLGIATPQATQRRRWMRAIVIAGVGIPALATAAVAGFFVNQMNEERRVRQDEQKQAQQHTDVLTAWQSAREIGSSQALKQFVADYPDSPYGTQAERLIAYAEARESQALSDADRAAAEQRAWDRAVQLGTIAAYENFTIAYNRSGRVDDANDAIAEITRSERRQDDQHAWRTATQTPDQPDGYRTYLVGADAGRYDGQHRDEAEERLRDLGAAQNRADDRTAWRRADSAGTIRAFQDYIAWARDNDGAYMTEANAAITRLQREDQLIAVARRLEPSSSYATVSPELSANLRDAYDAYLSEFPRGRFANEAQQKRDRYRGQYDDAVEDNNAFTEARNTAAPNTRRALERYRYRAGARNAQRAGELIRELDDADNRMWRRANEETDPQRRRERIRQYLDTYEDDSEALNESAAVSALRRLDAEERRQAEEREQATRLPPTPVVGSPPTERPVSPPTQRPVSPTVISPTTTQVDSTTPAGPISPPPLRPRPVSPPVAPPITTGVESAPPTERPVSPPATPAAQQVPAAQQEELPPAAAEN